MLLMYRSGVILPCSQAPEELRLFNMQEQQKQQKASGTLGVLNQVVIYESDYVNFLLIVLNVM